MNKISVVIRNKNQDKALAFLLKNLTERYRNDIDEIIVIDNLSTDNSEIITKEYNAKFATIREFGYGSSANFAAKEAQHGIVVIFSAHAYPVSHDFFKEIKKRFENNSNLAGLRCLHNGNDYKQYINNVSALEDTRSSGLIFCGSAFNKKVWELHKFKDDIVTFEDKEWSKRVLKAGYDIEFSPSIFHYEIKRTKSQNFFRFKKETEGSYCLWHKDFSFIDAIKFLLSELIYLTLNVLTNIFYAFRKFFFRIKFLINKPQKY